MEHPLDVIVARNEPVTLNCKVTGDPEPSVEWLKDGQLVRTARDDPRSHRSVNIRDRDIVQIPVSADRLTVP